MVLTNALLSDYRSRPAPFAGNGLGAFTFQRTYSRDGAESWADVCERVVEGMYSFQREAGPNWNEEKAQRSAAETYDHLFNLKWSPPGRGLWSMGTPFVHERGMVEALQNCAFISSDYLPKEKGSFFAWIMNMLMMGVGVGFDTRGADRVRLSIPDSLDSQIYEIPDTREGWAESVERLVDSYLIPGSPHLYIGYQLLRAKGEPIRGFGGESSGPEPLKELHLQIRGVLGNRARSQNPYMSSRDITDIGNMIGQCVVAGNVRRSAEIVLGSPGDEDFLNLKNYEMNPDRVAYGGMSNNSILNPGRDDLAGIAERIHANGEPGVVWLENAIKYGRMDGHPMSDPNVKGVNPCAEQMLGHREMCTLVEIFLPNITNRLEFARVIKAAFLYGKSVSLANDRIHDPVTRDIMVENRRIGLSLTGIAQFVGKHGIASLVEWMNYGYRLAEYYDYLYSEWLGVNPSIRRTTVKPSGTVSLLAGVTPGVHYPIGRYYIRRVGVASNSPLVDQMLAGGYRVEPDAYSDTMVKVEFPVDLGPGVIGESDVPLEAQMTLAQIAQEYWSDNGVSWTGKFDRDKYSPAALENLLGVASTKLKAVSMLPIDNTTYPQMPYETISPEDYQNYRDQLSPVNLRVGVADHVEDKYCDTDTCEIPVG